LKTDLSGGGPKREKREQHAWMINFVRVACTGGGEGRVGRITTSSFGGQKKEVDLKLGSVGDKGLGEGGQIVDNARGRSVVKA